MDPIGKLLLACRNGDIIEVRKSVESGTDVNEISKPPWYPSANWYSPIDTASRFGHLDVVKYLASKGANVSSDSNYPFRIAVKYGYINIMKFLNEKGVDPATYRIWTIKGACRDGRIDVLKYLVNKGVEISDRIEELLELATRYGKLKIVKYLVNMGGSIKIDGKLYPVEIANTTSHRYIVDYFVNLILNERKKRILLALMNSEKILYRDLLILIFSKWIKYNKNIYDLHADYK